MIQKRLIPKKFIKCLAPLLMMIITLYSCGPKPPEYRPVSKQQAETVIAELAGTVKTDTDLYHTYEKSKQTSRYWKGGLTWQTSTTNTLTLSKIDGNYVEGRINSKTDGVLATPSTFFGRFNDTHLYVYVTQEGDYWPSIYQYEISQDSRVLIYKSLAYRNLYSSLKWYKAPTLNVRNNEDNPRGWRIYKSSGYVSQTDDFVGEKRSKNSNKEQTLTEKIKELKELLDTNVITKEEYEKLRKKLIEG